MGNCSTKPKQPEEAAEQSLGPREKAQKARRALGNAAYTVLQLGEAFPIVGGVVDGLKRLVDQFVAARETVHASKEFLDAEARCSGKALQLVLLEERIMENDDSTDPSLSESLKRCLKKAAAALKAVTSEAKSIVASSSDAINMVNALLARFNSAMDDVDKALKELEFFLAIDNNAKLCDIRFATDLLLQESGYGLVRKVNCLMKQGKDCEASAMIEKHALTFVEVQDSDSTEKKRFIIEKKYDPDLLKAKAILDAKSGNCHDSVVAYQTLLEATPEPNAPAWYGLGTVLAAPDNTLQRVSISGVGYNAKAAYQKAAEQDSSIREELGPLIEEMEN